MYSKVIVFQLSFIKLLNNQIRTMRFSTLLLFISLFIFSACQTGSNDQAATSSSTPAKMETKAETPSTSNSNNKYTLTPFAPSQHFYDARIKDWSFIDGKFNIKC